MGRGSNRAGKNSSRALLPSWQSQPTCLWGLTNNTGHALSGPHLSTCPRFCLSLPVVLSHFYSSPRPLGPWGGQGGRERGDRWEGGRVGWQGTRGGGAVGRLGLLPTSLTCMRCASVFSPAAKADEVRLPLL